MSDRIELNEMEMDSIVGGALKWKGGIVYPKNNPDCKYSYSDYTTCAQWLVANWNGTQNESCLQAMEAAHLVHKID